jgi:hypothetical protein
MTNRTIKVTKMMAQIWPDARETRIHVVRESIDQRGDRINNQAFEEALAPGVAPILFLHGDFPVALDAVVAEMRPSWVAMQLRTLLILLLTLVW